MPTAKRKRATKKRSTKKKTTQKKEKLQETASAAAAAPAEEEEAPKADSNNFQRDLAKATYITDTMEVHKKVLAGFKYVTDEEQWGTVVDDWRIPENLVRVTGDCDDFAIACRELLREKGHKPRLVFCYTEMGDGHLICTLGKMALDNRQRTAVTIESLVDSRTPYHFVSASGTSIGEEWRSIRLDWDSDDGAGLTET